MPLAGVVCYSTRVLKAQPVCDLGLGHRAAARGALIATLATGAQPGAPGIQAPAPRLATSNGPGGPKSLPPQALRYWATKDTRCEMEYRCARTSLKPRDAHRGKQGSLTQPGRLGATWAVRSEVHMHGRRSGLPLNRRTGCTTLGCVSGLKAKAVPQTLGEWCCHTTIADGPCRPRCVSRLASTKHHARSR